MTSSKSTDFIVKAKLKHGDTYDYSKTDYVRNSLKVVIICRLHGEFTQTPNSHLAGRGCRACGLTRLAERSAAAKLTTAGFVVKARKLHGDKYSYSRATYVNYHTPISVTCPRHGDFYPTPANHLSNGTGCPICATKARNAALAKSFASFVAAAKRLHGEAFSYAETDRLTGTGRTAAIVTCPTHGDFLISRRGHLDGRGCPDCAPGRIKSKLRMPFSELLPRFRARHGSLYDYDESSHTDTKGTVRARCVIHGWFEHSVQAHLLGGGCPRCGSSCFQRSVGAFLESLGQQTTYNDRSLLAGLELDLLVANRRLAVECDGLYWHSFDNLETKKERYKHHHKHTLAAAQGLSLISIREDEWLTKQGLIESMLRHRLGLSTKRIYARNCGVVKVGHALAESFSNANHVSGFRAASHAYGLDFDGRLVALMSFSAHPKYQFEVIRYCTDRETCVTGGAGRLLSAFCREVGPSSILSYADRRYSQGRLYKQLGFKLDGITGPNYGYVKGLGVYSRQRFQKHKLAAKLPLFDPALSEAENMFANGYRRLWDAGHYRFIWRA